MIGKNCHKLFLKLLDCRVAIKSVTILFVANKAREIAIYTNDSFFMGKSESFSVKNRIHTRTTDDD